MNNLMEVLKGGGGSGDFGHIGRAGRRGGSGGGGGKGKPRKGRRSRKVLDKEIEARKKPKEKPLTKGDSVVIAPDSWPPGKKATVVGPSKHNPKRISIRYEDGKMGNKHPFELVRVDSPGKLKPVKTTQTVPSKSTQSVKGRTKRPNDEKPLTVYHATSGDAVKSILETGLRVTAASGSDHLGIPIPKGVYHTKKLESAKEYGDAHGDTYAIIEFEIPKKEKNKVHVDQYDLQMYESTDAHYYENAVPPEWIKKVHVYKYDPNTGHTRVNTTEKETKDTSFSVVGIKEPTKKKTKLKNVYHVLIGNADE